jgi:hypothetical protein
MTFTADDWVLNVTGHSFMLLKAKLVAIMAPPLEGLSIIACSEIGIAATGIAFHDLVCGCKRHTT